MSEAAVRRRANPAATGRMWCIPHSGAGASAFAPWTPHVPASFELCRIQLPGREDRTAEPMPATLEALVTDLASAVAPHLDLPFVLFGHSGGAIVAFELARVLARRGTPPLRLIVSACRAPHLPPRGRPFHELADRELLDEIRRLDGTPEDALGNADLMALVLRRIRTDVALFESHRRETAPIDCPITAIGGLADDSVGRDELLAWSSQTTAAFRLRMVEGDHFYVMKRAGEVVHLLAGELEDAVHAAAPRIGARC